MYSNKSFTAQDTHHQQQSDGGAFVPAFPNVNATATTEYGGSVRYYEPQGGADTQSGRYSAFVDSALRAGGVDAQRPTTATRSSGNSGSGWSHRAGTADTMRSGLAHDIATTRASTHDGGKMKKPASPNEGSSSSFWMYLGIGVVAASGAYLLVRYLSHRQQGAAAKKAPTPATTVPNNPQQPHLASATDPVATSSSSPPPSPDRHTTATTNTAPDHAKPSYSLADDPNVWQSLDSNLNTQMISLDDNAVNTAEDSIGCSASHTTDPHSSSLVGGDSEPHHHDQHTVSSPLAMGDNTTLVMRPTEEDERHHNHQQVESGATTDSATRRRQQHDGFVVV